MHCCCCCNWSCCRALHDGALGRVELMSGFIDGADGCGGGGTDVALAVGTNSSWFRCSVCELDGVLPFMMHAYNEIQE